MPGQKPPPRRPPFDRPARSLVLPDLRDDLGMVLGIRTFDEINALHRFPGPVLLDRLLEEEHRSAELKLVAVVQLFQTDECAVDVRAVGAATVGNNEESVGAMDLCMLPRSFGIADANFVAAAAPQPDRLIADLEPDSLISPADDQERRSRQAGFLISWHVDGLRK